MSKVTRFTVASLARSQFEGAKGGSWIELCRKLERVGGGLFAISFDTKLFLFYQSPVNRMPVFLESPVQNFQES